MILYQLKRLFDAEKSQKIIIFGQLERMDEKIVMAYFKVIFQSENYLVIHCCN